MKPVMTLWFIVLALPLFFLAGCANEPTRLEGSGAQVVPHPSYTKLCQDMPDFAGCPK